MTALKRPRPPASIFSEVIKHKAHSFCKLIQGLLPETLQYNITMPYMMLSWVRGTA